MPPHAASASPETTRDCGRFLLDVFGRYSAEHIEVRWRDESRPSNPQVDEIIEKAWEKELARTEGTDRRLFDGKVCRLLGHETIEQRLVLHLGPARFREFVGTNLTNAYLRYIHGPEVLADPLGVSAALVTEDGFLLLGKRSEKVCYHPGRIHPIAGVVEPSADPACPPDPFRTMADEICQETALPGERIENMVCLGLVRDKHIVQPELIFDVAVNANVEDLRRDSRTARDAHEHSDIVPVRDHPAAVVTFIQRNADQLTPIALATVLLHGLTHWGTGWFASARGYLRTMF